MCADTVKAILDGRKSQTRRVIKPSLGSAAEWTPWEGAGTYRANGLIGDIPIEARASILYCPYEAGMKLWVRETWRAHDGMTLHCRHKDEIEYRADGDRPKEPTDSYWRPSIHMPRWASRITLEVVSVRVERVQEISEEDAKAEGVQPMQKGHGYWGPDLDGLGDYHRIVSGQKQRGYGLAAWAYRALWDSLNAERGFGWEKNPWVWVIEFKKL